MAPPDKRLQGVVLALLGLGCLGLDWGQPLAWLSLALVLVVLLKLAEARQREERRLVALLQVLACGLLAAQQPQLLASALQGVALLGALAGLLQQSAKPGLGSAPLLRRSLLLVLAGLPLALWLWLLLPRLGPLWPLAPRSGDRGISGLRAELDPGSLAELASSDAPAARVSFSPGPPPGASGRYWRVMVHSSFDGSRWLPAPAPLARFQAPQPPVGAPSQLWLVEPAAVQPMPWDGASLPTTTGAWIDAAGMLQIERPSRDRRTLLLLADRRATAWQWFPPTAEEGSLPWGENPRLEALGRRWRALPPPQRLAAAKRLLLEGGHRYTLRPGSLPAQGGLDVLLFERRQGFCGHYASLLSALMRAAGLPARVVSGYQGGRWVPLLGGTGFLDLRQSDAHAWSEVWLAGRWQAVDPSAWLVAADVSSREVPLGPWPMLQAQAMGLELLWSRWWLGFDATRQTQLLAWLGKDQQLWWAVVPLAASALLWLVGALALRAASRRPPADRLARDWQRWRRRLERQGIEPRAGETLPQLLNRLAVSHPQLADLMAPLGRRHEQQRYGPAPHRRGGLGWWRPRRSGRRQP